MFNWQPILVKIALYSIAFNPILLLKAQVNGQIIEHSLPDNKKFTITHYSIKEGLPQNQVNEIISKNNSYRPFLKS